MQAPGCVGLAELALGEPPERSVVHDDAVPDHGDAVDRQLRGADLGAHRREPLAVHPLRRRRRGAPAGRRPVRRLGRRRLEHAARPVGQARREAVEGRKQGGLHETLELGAAGDERCDLGVGAVLRNGDLDREPRLAGLAALVELPVQLLADALPERCRRRDSLAGRELTQRGGRREVAVGLDDKTRRVAQRIAGTNAGPDATDVQPAGTCAVHPWLGS